MVILVSTPEDLDNIRNDTKGHYELTNDIDMSEWGDFEPIGRYPYFTGSLDGKGFVIKNLTINKNDSYPVGLFSRLDTGGIVKNLGIESAYVFSNYSYASTGVLIGQAENICRVTNCYTTGELFSNYYGGGLIGSANNDSTQVTNCFSYAKVTAGEENTSNIGGLIGRVSSSRLTNCYATGLVTGNSSTTSGGLIGGGYTHVDNVINCYYDTETTGQDTSYRGEGKTTAEMKQQSTYIDWDFDTVWGYAGDYPFLRRFDTSRLVAVSSSINPIHTTAQKIAKKTLQTTSYISPLWTYPSVLIPTDDQVVNAYLSWTENTTNISHSENKTVLRTIENPSIIEVME